MAPKAYILTLDAGTGSGRAVIFDTDGAAVSFAQREWLPKVRPEYPGSQVFDTREAWDALRQCIQEALEKARLKANQIMGVSASSMREGMVLYDKDRNELWACPNIDARAREEVVEMLSLGIAEKIYRLGGDWLNIIAPPRFRWIEKYEPQILEKTAYMNMISDWILFKLSGEIVTDPSVGSSSGIFDLASRSWSKVAIDLCSLPRKIYPPVYESGTVIGKVTKEAARATGLRRGTPVITGGADTQLALLGVGNILPNLWAVVAGTFWQTTVIWDRPLIDPECRPRTLCHVKPGQWMTEGIAFLIGQQARWFRDSFCQEEVRLAKEQGKDPYYLMEKLAERVPPGAHGVLGLFSNLHNSKCWKHAAPSFVNFGIYNPQESGKPECIRALWESAAYAAFGNLKILEDLTNTQPAEITFCGGSAQGFLWPQIVADVFGTPIKVPVVKESTSTGCAMCAGLGAGLFHSFEEAVEAWVKTERVLEPDARAHEIYTQQYERWRRVLTGFMSIVNQGDLTPMWRAPGV